MAGGEDLRVQVMMVGGRRCGKTSILAAMKENFEDKFANTDLTIVPGDMETLTILDEKRNEINEYFRGVAKRTFTPDSNPTEEMMTYSFFIGIAGKKGKIRVDFVDYPGEWLTDTVHLKQLEECMKKSQSVIIAIDTPHMMEEEGQFNERRNFCNRTCEILKRALQNAKVERNMVLFVPLKCELYRKNERMEEVCEKTEEAYEELIRFFKRQGQKYEVAVTPIFTLGGAMFSHFERNSETGEINMDERFRTPQNSIYYFPDITVKKPAPEYCEQPLVYLLAYIMHMAGDAKKGNFSKNNLWGKVWMYLQESFFNFSSAEDYYAQKNIIMKKLKKTGDGYHILQNPIKF